jgi:type IV pilus assembly protein PilM
MDLLPKTLGTRPRLAVEIRPEGVVAARAEDALALVSATSYGMFEEGTLAPGLKAGNVVARKVAVAAVKKALEAVALKERAVTVVMPDAAVRVLLLDFDSLPAKLVEALPIVRFRLKKLLPFDADDAVVSFQVMSTSKGLVRVLAVAVPKDVLAEYEGLVREAGFEPGAVMPSTLAAVAGLGEELSAVLLVNAGETAVTTAIVQGGVLLLHRTVDLAAEGVQEMMAAAPVVMEVPVELLAGSQRPQALPLVDVDSSAGEWARQEPVNGYGVIDDYRMSEAERLTQEAESDRLAREIEAEALAEVVAEDARLPPEERMAAPVDRFEVDLLASRLAAAAREVTQAVSVAAAYFEDTLRMTPGAVISAGTMGAERLGGLLTEAGFSDGEMQVREMVEPGMLTGGAVTTRVPREWMAGVRGALRS